MDPILQAALRGTAAGGLPPPTGTPLDALLSAIEGGSAEDRLLGQVAAWSVYRTAAYAPPEVPPPADRPAEETAPACSARAARWVQELLSGRRTALLADLAGRIEQAGQVLPAGLLPLVLDTRDPAERAALRPLLGQRGRWLARFLPAWDWARESPAASVAEAFSTASHAERCRLLAEIRRTDAAAGRQLLADGWNQEKADRRAELLAVLEIGLSADDEDLLNRALADRSAAVRQRAADMLARLPGSDLAARMAGRASSMWQPVRPARGSSAAWRFEPPVELDRAWRQDGLPAWTGAGGERSWWAVHTLRLVPPAHWLGRLGKDPRQILSAVADDEWYDAALAGLVQAAALHRDAAWAEALWDACGAGRAASREPGQRSDLRQHLVHCLPREVLAARLAEEVGRAESGPELVQWLAAVSPPWPPALAESYLEALGRHLSRLGPDAWGESLLATLEAAGRCLPVHLADRLAALCRPWADPPAARRDRWQPAAARELAWRTRLAELVDTIRMRAAFAEEIPL